MTTQHILCLLGTFVLGSTFGCADDGSEASADAGSETGSGVSSGAMTSAQTTGSLTGTSGTSSGSTTGTLVTTGASEGSDATTASQTSTTGDPDSVTLRRTRHGLAHIDAEDFEGAGYGVGYAYAQDNACLLAHRVAQVNGRLSLHLGPEALVRAQVHDMVLTALQSDHFHLAWFDRELIRRQYEAGSPEVLALADGYVAGVQRYLDDHPQRSPCPVPWTRAMTREDAFMVWTAAATVSSGEHFMPHLPTSWPSEAALSGRFAPMSAPREFGSNAWALGAEATRGDGSIHLYNPHFPWSGIHRIHTLHVRIGDELDIFGATLGGFPVPMSGFNADVAWGLTFSNTPRWYGQELELAEGGRSFVVDGELEAIEESWVEIPVPGGGEPLRRPVYRADGRPIIDAPAFGLGWTASRAIAIVDINVDNTRLAEQFIAMARASSVHDLQAGLAAHRGIPWSYTVAGDRHGDVLFADISAVPDLDGATIGDCLTELGQLHLAHGMVILDGTRARCRKDGLMAATDMPHVVRRDYVANGNNDIGWPNAVAPLRGSSPIFGGPETPLSLRASLGLHMIHDRLAGTDGLEGTGFDRENALAVFRQARNRAAEILVAGIVEDCEANPVGHHLGEAIDLGPACAALGAWDRRNTTTSRGAFVFRGMWRALSQHGVLFAEPAVGAEPMASPRGYTDDPGVRTRVRDALARVTVSARDRGLELDVTWGEVHRVNGPEASHAMPGGWAAEGIFDAIIAREAFQSYDGWLQTLAGVTPDQLYGASYLQLVEFGPTGPSAIGLTTYGQSTDPASPWAHDQLSAWSRGAWGRLPFAEADIVADQVGPTLQLR